MAPSTDSNYDCESLTSYSSSRYDEGNDLNSGSIQETINENDFEEKLMQAFENISLKSAKVRLNGLEAIKKALSKRYLFDFLIERKASITEILERCIKRGKGEEQGIGATLAALVFITLGTGDETDSIFSELEPHMLSILKDKNVGESIRSRFALSLGLCCFIAANGAESVDSIMDCYHSIFSASYFKGNGMLPNLTPQVTSLHASALSAWTLLLTIQPISKATRLADKHVRRIIQLLNSNDVDLRIAAGETIAVLFEIFPNCQDWHLDNEDVLCEKLKELATDSQKFRAKKDRRLQRSSFRDVLKYIEDDLSPSLTVKFNKEQLHIETWCRKRQYDALCHVLGSGMNLHLTENELLRDVFELGPPITETVTKATKFERKMENIATSKARTKCRSKLRDKRADIL